MHSPVSDKPMIILELHGVEVDYCPDDGGIWLDEGELELLLGDTESALTLLNSFEKTEESGEKSYPCPICRKQMEKVYVGEGDKRVLVDRCRNGDGLWFDKGELHDIIAMGSLTEGNKVLQLLNDMFEYDLKKDKTGGKA